MSNVNPVGLEGWHVNLLFLPLMHGIAAAGLFYWSRRYGFDGAAVKRWTISGLILGMAPFGIFTWQTRGDWSFANKLMGVVFMAGVEIVILAVGIGGILGRWH